MQKQEMETMHYRKFGLMMLIGFLVMYVVMFLNMDKFSHYHTSITRIYMAILMVTPMAVYMLLMMGKMYPDRKKNILIISVSVIVFILCLIGLRSQTPVGDVQYMKAMIPHHSSAIMVSQNASITDPEVRELADSIIATQIREIAQMEGVLKRLNAE
jgi:uncharacterized protein (DUF305 family)